MLKKKICISGQEYGQRQSEKIISEDIWIGWELVYFSQDALPNYFQLFNYYSFLWYLKSWDTYWFITVYMKYCYDKTKR